MAPANPIRVGTSGVNNSPATPKTVNAPAIPNKAIPIPSRLICDNSNNCGVNNAIAPATTTNAAAPTTAPDIAYIATPKMVSAPANVTKPLPISSQDMFPNDFKANPSNPKAADITVNPAPTVAILTPEISVEATPNTVNPPAIASSPFPISSHDIVLKDLTASANTTRLAAIRFNATPKPIMLNPPAVNALNKEISVSIPAIPPKPLMIEFGSILPKPSTASFKTNKAADRIKIPVAEVIPNPPNLAPAIKSASSPNNIPIADNPVPNTSASIEPIFSKAPAITCNAEANINRPVADETILP